MTSASEIISVLGGNERTGMCCCPAHDDNTPSLKVQEENGKVLVKCFAGCAQDAVIDALRERGLWQGGGQSIKRYRKSRERQHPSEIERFDRAHAILRAAANSKQAPTDYFRNRGIERVPPNAKMLTAKNAARLTDKRYPAVVFLITDGNVLLGAHVTFLSKDGKVNARDSDGKSLRRSFGMVKGGYIAFGPDQPDQPLCVTEGIEDALSVMQITKLPAIAARSAGNLKEISLPPCSELIICADNDETGLRAAEQAAARFAGSSRRVRIAVPRSHKDWNEALNDSKADLDDLRRAISRAPKYESAEIASLGMGSFLGLRFPPRTYLLKPWLTTTGLAMMDASPGHGKTWLALSIAYAVATGQPLMGWQCERRARVLYVDGELPGTTLQERIRLLGPVVPETDLRLLSHAQFSARGEMMLDLGTEEGRAALDAEIEKHAIELVILDSVSTLVRSGEDNDIASWRAVQDWSLKHRARGRAVIYLHHHGRSGNPRGTSAREIVLDTRIKLTHDAEASSNTETALKLEFAKTREFFGADAEPMVAYLSTEEGVVSWRRESVRASNAQRVKELLDGGVKPADIARELDVSRAAVSLIMKKLGLKANPSTPVKTKSS